MNALDAANLFFAGLNALRQHVTPDVRMHGIITHGGDAVNVVPKETRLTVVVRAARRRYLHEELLPRVRAVVEGAALMTGCRHAITEPAPAYEDLQHNPVLLEVFERAARAVGRQPAPSQDTTFGSTDAGNVSRVVPTVHPTLSIGSDAGLHTPDFELAAGSPDGERCLADGLRALALCAADLFLDPLLVEQAWRAHREGDL